MKRKFKIIKVKSVNYPEAVTVYDVDSLDRLKEMCSPDYPIYETSDNFHALFSDNVIVRFMKSDVQPEIIKVDSLELNPEYYGVKIHLSMKQLLEFAKREHHCVFETKSDYIILGKMILVFAKKERSAK